MLRPVGSTIRPAWLAQAEAQSRRPTYSSPVVPSYLYATTTTFTLFPRNPLVQTRMTCYPPLIHSSSRGSQLRYLPSLLIESRAVHLPQVAVPSRTSVHIRCLLTPAINVLL
jgi:hypothetical protein